MVKIGLLLMSIAGLGSAQGFQSYRTVAPDPYYISPSSPVIQPRDLYDPYVPVTSSNYRDQYSVNGYAQRVINSYDSQQYVNNYQQTYTYKNQPQPSYGIPQRAPVVSNNYQNSQTWISSTLPSYSSQYSSFQSSPYSSGPGFQYPNPQYPSSSQYPSSPQYPSVSQYAPVPQYPSSVQYQYANPQLRSQPRDSYVNENNYGSNSANTDEPCYPPRTFIGGICRCPDDRMFVAGKCVVRTTPNNCNPPRTIIQGECVCPGNRIYVSGNSCVENNDANNNQFMFVDQSHYIDQIGCKPPRVFTANRYCLCQNNGIYSGGQCLLNINYSKNQDPFYSRDLDSIAALGQFYRTLDGTRNNIQNLQWGSKGQLLQRRANANYIDGTDLPVNHLPSARVISNQLGALGYQVLQKSRDKITSMTTFFGQFVDHDLDLTQFGSNEPMNIPVPAGDLFFKNQAQLNFKRSSFVKKNGVRMHKNIITSWIDGNQIYGSDEETCRNLRSFKDGKLKASVDNMLPRQPNLGFFLAGDVRANQNVMLTALQTVFLREHNRICDEIKASHPQLNDQAIFRSARQWIIGLLQKITMEEYVPILLGDEYNRIIGRYYGYKAHLNPNIPTQFATAAYRVGHSLLVDIYTFINKNGTAYQTNRLTDLFVNPKYINSQKLEDGLRGLTKTLQKQKSIKLSDQVRNWLIVDPSNKQMRLDLFALNIQRGRDHGLPTYNQARVAYGLPRVTTFDQIQSDPVRAENLRRVYKNRVDDVELFVGIISQVPVKNGILGELGCQIVGQTFRNLRDGDRFWFQSAYPQNVVTKIKSTTLADIIRRNTNIGFQIQDDVWRNFQKY